VVVLANASELADSGVIATLARDVLALLLKEAEIRSDPETYIGAIQRLPITISFAAKHSTCLVARPD
jgi:hypothetical protein